MNFFVQIVADFFREGGERAETWSRRRDELDRQERARRERDRQSAKQRRAVAADLDSFFARVNDGEPERKVADLLRSLEQRVYTTDEHKTLDQQASDLLDVEVQAIKQLENLRRSCRTERPSGVGLTRELNRDWDAYLGELEHLEKRVFFPAEVQIGGIVADATRQRKLLLDRRQRIERLLNEVTDSSQRSTQREVEETEGELRKTRDRTLELAQQAIAEMKDIVGEVRSALERLDWGEMDQEEVESFRREWERTISDKAERYQEVLTHIRTQFANINWSRDERGYLIGDADMTAALEEELLAVRERAEADLQLSQLGMAIEIINHEFGSAPRQLR